MVKHPGFGHQEPTLATKSVELGRYKQVMSDEDRIAILVTHFDPIHSTSKMEATGVEPARTSEFRPREQVCLYCSTMVGPLGYSRYAVVTGTTPLPNTPLMQESLATAPPEEHTWGGCEAFWRHGGA
jgi:hypothetical protein